MSGLRGQLSRAWAAALEGFEESLAESPRRRSTAKTYVRHVEWLAAAADGVPALAASLETDQMYHRQHSEEIDFSAAAHFTRYFAAQLLEKRMPPDVDVLKLDVPDDATPATLWRVTRLSRESYFHALHSGRTHLAEKRRLDYGISVDFDRLEDEILENADTGQRLRLLEIKHSLVAVRQTVSSQRDVLAGRREILETLPGFSDREGRESLRDIFDRVSLVSQQVDNVRESVSNALDLYVSAVANELNQIIKVLTIVATFFLPLTFVTGFFGQNFGWLVRHVASPEAFALLGLGINAVIVIGLWTWFTRAGYIPVSYTHLTLPTISSV
mgnify:CR=1 FL=1